MNIGRDRTTGRATESSAHSEDDAHPETSAWLSRSKVRKGLRRSATASLSVLIPYWASRSIRDSYGDTPRADGRDGADDEDADGGSTGAGRRPHAAAERSDANARGTDRLALIEAMATTTPRPRHVSASPAVIESTSTRVAVLPMTAQEPEPTPTAVPRPTHPGEWGEPTTRWLAQAEDLVALQMVDFISECTIQLKNLVGYLAVCPLMLMLAATSYPFQPQRFLFVVIGALLIVVAACIVWAYIQMERDEVLSRISKTRPNQVEFSAGFLARITTILIPIAGVLLAQFPSVSDALSQFINPIVRVLK